MVGRLHQSDPSSRVPRLGTVRLQEMESAAVLKQILTLRAAVWSGRISLSPDILRWGDALDTRASHFCMFNDAELVAAGRMSFHASLADMPDRPLLEPLAMRLRFPLAIMSHCVAYPTFARLHLDKALDAARIERASQRRVAMILAIAEDRDRATALEQAGFSGVGHIAKARRGDPVRGRRALVLDLIPGAAALGLKS